MDLIEFIGLRLFFYIAFSAILNVIWYSIKIPQLKIWFPKSKKYHSDKVSPIYKVISNNDFINVYKYSLRYDYLENLCQLLTILFPYPLYIQKYKYFCEPEKFSMIESNYDKIFTAEDLKLFYEQKLQNRINDIENGLKIINEKYDRIQKIYDRIQKINSQFNENYE